MRIVRIGLISLAAHLCVIGLRAEPNPTVAELLRRQQGWQEKLNAAIRSVEADSRRPTMENISGAWCAEPGGGGPSKVFAITEDGENKISGLGIFYSCMGSDPFQIEGTRENEIITLNCTDFHNGPPPPPDTLKFTIIGHEGGVALRPIGTDEPLGVFLLVPKVAYSKLNEAFLERIRARREADKNSKVVTTLRKRRVR